jgi:S-formylglutathione hydrolase FrmB
MPNLKPSSWFLLTASLVAQRPEWVKGEGPELAAGTFTERSFHADAVGREVSYGIYLPKSYAEEANKERRYPLIIWLHGMWEDHMRFHTRGGSKALDELIAAGDVPELILVSPNAGRTFYVNGKHSGKNEDMVVQDLLAHLDKTYRVDPARAQRAIMGVSMGGMGALNMAFHRPELFAVVATHSAAIFPPDPDNLSPRFKKALESPWVKQLKLEELFGDPWDKEVWQRNNPLHLASTLDVEALKGMAIYFDAGTRDRYQFDQLNRALHETLEARGVQHAWTHVEGGGHSWGDGLAKRSLPDSLRFVARAWAGARGKDSLQEALLPGGSSGPKGRSEPDGKGR